MRDAIVAEITKGRTRKCLYHFTRAKNLPIIDRFDALLSSYALYPENAGERRTEAKLVNYRGFEVTLNSHLRIPESMIDASVTLEQFRASLDRHVFFWPTIRDCRKMIETYQRREPEEEFAVLEFDAYSLMLENGSSVKLSKYDSGSAPRFPASCTYKKSPSMFLPLDSFRKVVNHTVPAKPSEIKEVLIEEQVHPISDYLRAVYIQHRHAVPERWSHLTRALAELMT
ncbi:hypothetical protein DVH26_15115 [Paenibacillus sp. H1-7]|uniref:DUF7002 family protein n=1 Tax=Paenibacillus sp. H1-7 TaxID=2282849 RepID=UPI001EF867D0|nr:hypothetical protein [Paenibacillus sp. H1-7]ULL15658.1 hypothetical protein DVH26_15115 [Paenibacillus sp. H1-7]